MQNKTGIYVFCGIEQLDQTFDQINEDINVYTIPYKNAAMVVAELPMKIYHPNKENLMMHQQVISSVMEKSDTVIPISFGNIFHTEEDVVALLESLYPQFEQLFPQIKGKIEVGLKVIGKKNWLENEIQKRPAMLKQKEIVHSKLEAAAYFDRIQLGEMAQKFFQALQSEIKTAIHDELAPITVSTQVNDPIGEKMLLNAAYLIDRDQEARFDEKVSELHDKWQDNVDFKYTGPWPAYNFINIKLKLEETS